MSSEFGRNQFQKPIIHGEKKILKINSIVLNIIERVLQEFLKHALRFSSECTNFPSIFGKKIRCFERRLQSAT